MSINPRSVKVLPPLLSGVSFSQPFRERLDFLGPWTIQHFGSQVQIIRVMMTETALLLTIKARGQRGQRPVRRATS